MIGIYGITLSTIIAMLAVSVPWETEVLFKHYFRRSPGDYYRTLITKTAVTFAVGVITYLICTLFCGNLLTVLIYRAIVCVIVPNGIFCFLYHKSEHFGYALNLVIMLGKRCKKAGN